MTTLFDTYALAGAALLAAATAAAWQGWWWRALAPAATSWQE